MNCFTMTIEDARNKPGSIGRTMMFTDLRLGYVFIAGRPLKEELRKQLA